MPAKIIINSDEVVVCPKCEHKFHLHQGIAQHTVDKYEREFEREFEKRGEELREELEREIKRKTIKEFSAKQTELEEKLTETEEALKRKEVLFKKAQKEAQAKAQEEFELEKKSIQDELTQKKKALREFRERELALIKEKQQLQEMKDNLELENQRKLDEERTKIQDEIVKKEAEKSLFREAQLKKQLEDALRANEDMRRKLEQGSQQLQGEVLELELEDVLRETFRTDEIEPVSKGIKGADVIQKVRNVSGHYCGSIIWETKRTKNWSDGWTEKLRHDQREAKAEIAVIVTSVLPKTVSHFGNLDGVWITGFESAIGLAAVLRAGMIQLYHARSSLVGKSEKMELVYNYLSGTEFRQRIEAIVESFISMKEDLDTEKRAMEKAWAKREKQIQKVVENTAGMYGNLQGIIGASLPQIRLLELPSD